MNEIIGKMHEHVQSKERGLPIVSVAFSKDKKLLASFPNATRGTKNNKGEEHAEGRVINYMEENEINESKVLLIITTTPCDKCAERIRNKDFLKILYLEDKFDENDILGKEDERIFKYQPENKKQTNLINIMITRFHAANKRNRKKTLYKNK